MLCVRVLFFYDLYTCFVCVYIFLICIILYDDICVFVLLAFCVIIMMCIRVFVGFYMCVVRLSTWFAWFVMLLYVFICVLSVLYDALWSYKIYMFLFVYCMIFMMCIRALLLCFVHVVWSYMIVYDFVYGVYGFTYAFYVCVRVLTVFWLYMVLCCVCFYFIVMRFCVFKISCAWFCMTLLDVICVLDMLRMIVYAFCMICIIQEIF